MKTDLFTKIVLLLILGCLVVLVIRGITVNHYFKNSVIAPHRVAESFIKPPIDFQPSQE